MLTSGTPGLSSALKAGLSLATLLCLFPAPATSQLSAFLLNEETEIRSIGFRFQASETFSRSELLGQIGLTERGRTYGLRKAVGFLPFLSKPGPHLFDPLSLQKDVARLRGFYRGDGFPEASIRYEVTLDQDRNLVDVEFLISEGRPLTLASVTYSGPAGDPVEKVLAPEVVPGWRRFAEGERALLGERIGDLARGQMVGGPIRWLKEHGYPFPAVDSYAELDSAAFQVALTIRIDPGHRSRIGSVEVEGVTSVGDEIVLREVPVRVGDWYSATKVSEGRQRIFSLDLFSVATADVAPIQEPDSTVRLLFRVREGRRRSLSGFLGYTNSGGMSFGGTWEHRNFLGGARTLAVSGTAETGSLAAFTGTADQFIRGAVSLRQPFLFVSGLSLVASPFGEYRDDYRDRSWEAGFDGTLVYQYAPLQALSLRSRISSRKVLEYRIEEMAVATASGLLGSSAIVDSLKHQVVVSALTLSATFGHLDDTANPKKGFVLQPSLEVTVPPGFPTNEYFKAELWGSLYRPLGSLALVAGNLRAGRLFPFGGSVPSSDSDGLLEFLQLRDVTLTAGGPTDVRGWGSRLMGPKVPDTNFRREADTTVYSASRYLPLGGLARISGAIELQVPIPGLGSGFAAHVFLDGGRVWTPDHRFLRSEDPFDQDKAYYSTGGGIGIETPVGPVRVSVGYKLNPSPLDLRDPGDVLQKLLEGESILEIPVQRSRRFQLHLTVGRAF